MHKKQIAYGVGSYPELVDRNGYFVDKTEYIRILEEYANPVYLRPRRFGKSLWCSILNNYYNVQKQDQFERLFGHTAIGKNPTPGKNSYMILHLDFSVIDVGTNLEEIEHSFKHHCNRVIKGVLEENRDYFKNELTIDQNAKAAFNLDELIQFIQRKKLPPLYIIIDEYDNFSNQLITAHEDILYQQLTSDTSFLKTFFKAIKTGRQAGAIANTFITGVLPITMDDLSSGYNIASFITLDAVFAGMLGYTQNEVDQLLDDIYKDYRLDSKTRKEVNALIRNHYNGYQFVTEAERLYNPTILMYFLRQLCSQRKIPEFLMDENLKIDISWIRRLTASNPEKTSKLVDQLSLEGIMEYDRRFLKEKFNMSQFFEEDYYPISFFYLGLLTIDDHYRLKTPNTNIRTIFIEYFNEIHRIDVSTKYADMMRTFEKNLDMEELFANYWQLYVSQFPESIFQQVNENFYRSTFYELCSRYLSHSFTWNIERSYPSGKSDLEFVGKYHSPFASLRFVIEFKYYSHARMRKEKIDIEQFKLNPEDVDQINGYCRDLGKEYPEAKISRYVIYCFANQGFRVFSV